MNRIARRWLSLVAVIIGLWFALLASLSPACAQDEEDELSPFAPGLIASFSGLQSTAATRIDETIAFHWGDSSPDARLPAGPFHAQWTGFLFVQSPGPHRLFVHGDGEFSVRLLDQTIIARRSNDTEWTESPPIDLPFGWHPLTLTYRRDTTDRAGRFALYWSGPRFDIEPVSSRFLFHDRQTSVSTDFARGERLARALRCDACHRQDAASTDAFPVPLLDHLPGNMFSEWLVAWLDDGGHAANERRAAAHNDNPVDPHVESAPKTNAADLQRRMPYFDLDTEQARALAAYLTAGRVPDDGSAADFSTADREAGRQLFLTLGCLACHGLESFGEAGLFGGGNLSQIAAKRPAAFFEQWLAAPEKLNPRHRMPVFQLEPEERRQLAAFLSSLGEPQPASGRFTDQQLAEGQKLYGEMRCAACHQQPRRNVESDSKLSHAMPLGSTSNWSRSCAAAPKSAQRQPGYQLTTADGRALQAYYTARQTVPQATSAELGRWVLSERNCLACHAREQAGGLTSRLPAVVENFPQLSSLMPALTPPSLNSVGDKLHDHALQAAIRREGAVRRPWLMVRMPRFSLSDKELQSLTRELVTTDRVPDEAPRRQHDVAEDVAFSSGPRLVTPDGFGCTSCHAVGKVRAPNAPLNTMGPDLLQLDKRIRRPWFDRFVRNPARIVPRMEMPSVQISVGGVLDDDLNQQLAAVWHTLNRPDFRPPEPNPLRVVRRSGVREQGQRAVWLSDVLQTSSHTFIKPLMIGLPNRHNFLLDLEHAQIVSWSLGDVARQRTRGKTWYWEPAGNELLFVKPGMSDLGLVQRDGQFAAPLKQGQFVTEFDEIRHLPDGGLELRHRLHFKDDSRLQVRQQFLSLWGSDSGAIRRIEVQGLADTAALGFRICDQQQWKQLRRSADGRQITLVDRGQSQVRIIEPADAKFDDSGLVVVPAKNATATLIVEYRTSLPVDQFLDPEIATPAAEIETLNIVPGFNVVRLGLPNDVMPTGLAWNTDGELLISSLKGRVWKAGDTNADGLEDALQLISDELAAPYGLLAGRGYVDVINKYALLRLQDDDGDGFCERTTTVASGWGHTDDYHDWAVGLERDIQGNYYVAFPCQQDQRSAEAAKHRGIVARLVPRSADDADPRLFVIQPISSGHRFPMGLARNAAGVLVVTDNQGNFNPFNELNHVRERAHFGFINALERSAGYQPPPLAPPAINLPHPWTRSVNGICFLQTPSGIAAGHFGPWEGHVVGCEYDTRKLIRMSLQEVNGTLQGAAYPLSHDYPAEGPTFLGPLVCSVSPQGDLYVGCIRDSGWGGANNIGGVVRLRRKAAELPCGIAEVRAEPNGFAIHFTTAIDPQRGGDLKNYVIASYRRISTPDYGGSDRDRRTERPSSVQVDSDGRTVHLQWDEPLRAGFVYEFHLRNLTSDAGTFFPAEAHYTLLEIPVAGK